MASLLTFSWVEIIRAPDVPDSSAISKAGQVEEDYHPPVVVEHRHPVNQFLEEKQEAELDGDHRGPSYHTTYSDPFVEVE